MLNPKSEKKNDSCGIRRNAISLEEAEEMGFVPSALGEPRGPSVGATIDAVKKPSDTGREPQWLLKVVKPAPSICVSSPTMRSWCSRANSTEIMGMEKG